MREIKFRGKRKDNGEMWCGDMSHHTTGKVFIKDISKGVHGTFEVAPETVGQYTGLKDKNGVEIYEGDIVMGIWAFGKEVPAVVAFADGAFGVKWCRDGVEEFTSFTTFCRVEWEVIGNIYDNPELLEELK